MIKASESGCRTLIANFWWRIVKGIWLNQSAITDEDVRIAALTITSVNCVAWLLITPNCFVYHFLNTKFKILSKKDIKMVDAATEDLTCPVAIKEITQITDWEAHFAKYSYTDEQKRIV